MNARALATLALALSLVLGPGAALAFSADDPLDDPALEARAKELHYTIRCMVCQGQSIADSNAELARDMRIIVREHIAAGETDDEVTAFLTDRYGDYVLLRPPVSPATYALWFGPAFVLVAGALAIFLVFRRRTTASPAAGGAVPLTAEERKRLEALLDDES